MGFSWQNVLFLVPMILSLTVHEWAHAWSAHKLGDDTALRLGRLTLNPIPHIDPIGTLLLPVMGIPFGWAKPVPVDPARFRRNVHMGTGMAITAMAGPLSNIILAVGCSVAMGLLLRFSQETIARQPGIWALLSFGVRLNVALALFNLIPLPPLDGSRVLERLIPYKHREAWESFARISPLLLFGVIVVGGSLLAGPMGYVTRILESLIRQIAGA